MDSSNDIQHPRRIKRSMAWVLLQAAVTFLVFNVAVANSSVAEGLFLALLMVTSLLSLGFAVHAASSEEDGFWWILPLAPVCIFLIFLGMAFSASYTPGS